MTKRRIILVVALLLVAASASATTPSQMSRSGQITGRIENVGYVAELKEYRITILVSEVVIEEQRPDLELESLADRVVTLRMSWPYEDAEVNPETLRPGDEIFASFSEWPDMTELSSEAGGVTGYYIAHVEVLDAPIRDGRISKKYIEWSPDVLQVQSNSSVETSDEPEDRSSGYGPSAPDMSFRRSVELALGMLLFGVVIGTGMFIWKKKQKPEAPKE